MASCPSRRILRRRALILLCSSAAVAVLAGGCAKDKYRQARPAAYGKTAAAAPTPGSPLQVATAHWSAAHLKNPKDPKAALNYALNLKALGAEAKAMEVLAQAHHDNPTDPAIASEYGRLALADNQISLAESLLTVAEKGTAKPDWKLLSALGTLHAKKGEPEAAQRYFIAALEKKPDSLSTTNNLALSYALNGNAEKAETLLRRVIDKGGDSKRVRQNLALVVGLQGKFNEGQQIAQADLPSEQADSNMNFLRNMIRHAPTAVAEKTDEPAAHEPAAKAAPPAPAPRAVASNTPPPTKAPAKTAAKKRDERSPSPKAKAKAKAGTTATIAKAETPPVPPKRRSPLEMWAAARAKGATTVASATPQAFEPLPWQTTTQATAPKASAPEAAAQDRGWGATVTPEPTRLAPPKR